MLAEQMEEPMKLVDLDLPWCLAKSQPSSDCSHLCAVCQTAGALEKVKDQTAVISPRSSLLSKAFSVGNRTLKGH